MDNPRVPAVCGISVSQNSPSLFSQYAPLSASYSTHSFSSNLLRFMGASVPRQRSPCIAISSQTWFTKDCQISEKISMRKSKTGANFTSLQTFLSLKVLIGTLFSSCLEKIRVVTRCNGTWPVGLQSIYQTVRFEKACSIIQVRHSRFTPKARNSSGLFSFVSGMPISE